ncbi:hypothetical protein BKA62DRAFT_713738 [Auriculariales sp. MPI-PUGE-AT-0066]|nr:hypothetical protein BKA62DRAFT_713738 [Auriculariales sp. MPI-PUGE-AT-0066]
MRFFTTSLAVLVSASVALGVFSNSCTNLSINETILSATCQGRTGPVATSIDLSNCVVERDLLLFCLSDTSETGTPHVLTERCDRFDLEKTQFSAICEDQATESGRQGIVDLDKCLRNVNGRLRC